MDAGTDPLALVAAPRFEAPLGFPPADHVEHDAARGLVRVRPMPVGREAEFVAWTRRTVHDLDGADGGHAGVLGLGRSGFDVTRVDHVRGLPALLDTVVADEALSEPMARRLRRRLWNAVLPLSDGGRARILFVAPEGTIHRHAGPAGRAHRPELVPTTTTHHGPASNLHVDQDVSGTPLRQWLLRLAPRLFAHEAPDSHNRSSRLRLVNLWIPLQQWTRPLVLLDGRTYDRRAHQALYALPVASILGRTGRMATNDIWAVLPGEGQRYYFHGGLQRGQALVFDTLSAPHGSFVLPGEDRVAVLADRVAPVCARLRAGDVAGAATEARQALHALRGSGGRLADDLPAERLPTSRALVAARDALLAVLDATATLAPGGADAGTVTALADRGESLAAGLVRRSIELRAVAWVTPPRTPP